MSDYQPEIATHTVTDSEHQFYAAFVTVLTHLKNRALNAEAEVLRLRKELDHRREQVEYYEKPAALFASHQGPPK